MDLTASNRATTATAAVALTAAITATLYGVIANEPARALGGVCLTMFALTLVLLVAIKRWITDTRDERRRLAEAIHDAQAEREAMAAEFEQKRATLICETLAAAPELLRNLDKKPNRSAVIQFPHQQLAQAPERERSRERNAVGP